ncbi:MAG: tetratricopeptide repeat protein [Magnetococcales bacterium]|nr:tetratricopeptide repeat protein [Magnetococcales bacterium]
MGLRCFFSRKWIGIGLSTGLVVVLLTSFLGGCIAPGAGDPADGESLPPLVAGENGVLTVAPVIATTTPGNGDPFGAEVKQGKAYYYYILGHILLRERNWHDAERALTEVAKADPQSVETRMLVAHLATQRGDLTKAIHFAEEAIALEPKEEKSRQLLAGLLTATKSYDKAAEQYEEILLLNPDQQAARLQLAQIYGQSNKIEQTRKALTPLFNKPNQAWKAYLALGRAYANLPDMEKAAAQFRKAYQLDPDKLESVLALGAVLQELKRPKDAEAVYRSFLVTHPDSKEIHSRMGRLYLNQDDQQAALAEFQTITQIAPDSVPARITSALILLSQRRLEEALQELRLAEATRQDDGRVSYYLGQVLELLDRSKEAETAYLKVNPKETFYADTQLRLAFLEAEGGRRAAGIQRIRALLATDATPLVTRTEQPPYLVTNDPKVQTTLWVALSVLLMQEEKYAEVVETTSQGLTLDPDHGRLRFNRAIALDKLNRWPEAEADLLLYIKQNPSDANALNYLGYSWTERNERLEEAIKLLEKALQLSPGDGFITDSMGWALFRLNRLDESLLRMREAVRLEPKDPTIHEHLGDVLHAMGKTAEAVEVWKKALALDPKNNNLQKKIAADDRPSPP